MTVEGNIVSLEQYKKDLQKRRTIDLSKPIAEEIYFFLGAWTRTKSERLALFAKFGGIGDPQNETVTLSVSRDEINKMADLLELTSEHDGVSDVPVKTVSIALGIMDDCFVKAGGAKSYVFLEKLGQINPQIAQRYEQNS